MCVGGFSFLYSYIWMVFVYMTGIHSEFKRTLFPDDSLRSLWMTFLIGFVLTRPNARGQQMIKTSVFIEVLTLGDDVLTKWV